MQSESDNVETLRSIMGDIDAEVARRVLLKHNNNLEAAASAYLEGDRGEPSSTTWHNEPIDLTDSGALNASASRRPNTPLAPEDATMKANNDIPALDDPYAYEQQLSRALEMSMESGSQTSFQKTDRAPDPNWQVVPSNVRAFTDFVVNHLHSDPQVPVKNQNHEQEQEDRTLSRAIEASLSTSFIEDRFEELSAERNIRKPGQ